MTMSSTSWRILLLCVAAGGLAVASCGHPGSGATGTGGSSATACTGSPGEEFCACLSGNTCNAGLQCADDVNKCVTIGPLGTGGSGNATGTGGTNPGTGGLLNTGGSSATGGSSGTGGSSTGGSGGNGSATGGSNGTGGQSGTNLVMNGDLSNGDTGWGVGQGSPTTKGVMNGQYCVTFSNMTILVGWGNGSGTAANLSSGSSYTLSYQASSTDSNTTVEVHIGQAVSPYNPDASNITGDKPGNSLTTFTHTFTSTANDTTAGLAFYFASSGSNVTACIDNVVLTKN